MLLRTAIGITDGIAVLGGAMLVLGGLAWWPDGVVWAQAAQAAPGAPGEGSAGAAVLVGVVAAVTPLVLRLIDLKRLRDDRRAVIEQNRRLQADLNRLRRWAVQVAIKHQEPLPDGFFGAVPIDPTVGRDADPEPEPEPELEPEAEAEPEPGPDPDGEPRP